MNPRVKAVPPGTRPELAELEARIKGARGRISPLYSVLLNSPLLASGWEQFFTVIRQKTSVPARLRELAILRVAVLNGAEYEFEAHVAHALAAGMTQEDVSKLKADRTEAFQGIERRVLQYTDAITRDLVVPDALYAQLDKAFEVRTLVELTATIAAYNMVSRFLIAMRIH
ncbi:MAG: carboxymuconolactone decarboxylase family protein [Betaproteobacteria bacterium]|nr:MAG: carboxymuconolactone decarboxylase family protein [Betaproteobacteria bacterium]